MKVHAALLTLLLVAPLVAGDRTDESEVLTGTFTERRCPTSEYYQGAYPTLLLDAPIVIDGLGQVDAVEIVLPERYFVGYQDFFGKHGSVTCSSLVQSAVCGPDSPRAICGVTYATIAP